VRDAELLANPGVFEGILDGPQTADAGIEESQEMGNDDVIEEDLAISVSGVLVEVPKLVLDQTNESPADDLVFRSGHRFDSQREVFGLASHGEQ